ncbi:MAG: radical SAM protein [Actinobacteria bacterium]|nr:radical SAM protein [Actinomycetota bacterium]
MKSRTSKFRQFCYFARFALISRIGSKYKKPLISSFKLTNRCTLKCLHCPFWRNNEILELNYGEAAAILQRLYKDGIKIIIFEGGEPLIWKDRESNKDIHDLIKMAEELFYYVGVTTNGTIEFADVESDIIFVSIDGMQKTHDAIRGKSFDRIIENIKANKNTKKIIANICISKINRKEIPELIKFLNDITYGITIQFFYPYSNVGDQTINLQEKEQLLKELVKLKKEGYKILDSTACLERMMKNTWKCYDFLVSSVEPDGKTYYGCYLKNKVDNVSCKDCGFAVHCEISLAYGLNIDALNSARKIFWGQVFKS